MLNRPTLLNGEFTPDLSQWSLTDANASCTWTRDTGIIYAGGVASSKIVNTTAGEDDWIGQNINASGLGLAPQTTVTVTAWLNVTAFTAAAISNRGLFLVSLTGNFSSATTSITAVTNGWKQHSVSITLGPGGGGQIETGLQIRLYAPQATVYWGGIRFYKVIDEQLAMSVSSNLHT